MNETFAVNASTGASTHYTGYDFTGFCRGHDGRYYGIKADGLYLLDGKADATIDYGDLAFGTPAEKLLSGAFFEGLSDSYMSIGLTAESDEYWYDARSFSDTPNAHRFDTGRGLKANYFGVKMKNTEGEYFEIDAVELAVVKTQRRI